MADSNLRFYNQGQEGIDPALRTVLASVAPAYGGLGITSGYRDPEHNKKVNGVKKSRHMSGRAADVDLSGMDTATRAALVNDLIKAGATGFITYDNSPNMLHVDVGRPNVHFMHNKSIKNIAKAPQWFRELHSQYQGLAPQSAAEYSASYRPQASQPTQAGPVPEGAMPGESLQQPEGSSVDDLLQAYSAVQMMTGGQRQPVDLIAPQVSRPVDRGPGPLARMGIGSLG